MVIKTLYKNDGNTSATVRELRARLGCNVAPNESYQFED